MSRKINVALTCAVPLERVGPIADADVRECIAEVIRIDLGRVRSADVEDVTIDTMTWTAGAPDRGPQRAQDGVRLDLEVLLRADDSADWTRIERALRRGVTCPLPAGGAVRIAGPVTVSDLRVTGSR